MTVGWASALGRSCLPRSDASRESRVTQPGGPASLSFTPERITMRAVFVTLLSAVFVLSTPPTSDSAALPDRISEQSTAVATIGLWHSRKLGFSAKPSRTTSRKSKVSPSSSKIWSSPKAYARKQVGSAQFGCLERLWERESGWNPHANNPSSSAYGIPQALPGARMASAGADWRSNPVTQVRWGLGYIRARYGTPCGAWAHSQSHGWY